MDSGTTVSRAELSQEPRRTKGTEPPLSASAMGTTFGRYQLLWKRKQQFLAKMSTKMDLSTDNEP